MENQEISNKEDVADLQGLKELARQYLTANQVDKALLTYARILSEFPDDLDSLLILGDSYLIGGNKLAARDLYQEAMRWAPERKDIARRREFAVDDLVDSNEPPLRLPPLHPQAINRLVMNLMGKNVHVREEDVQKVEKLFEQIIRSPSPAKAVSEHLEEIDELLPALIEMNVRQARKNGRSDLVDELETLLVNLSMQQEHKPDEMDAPALNESDSPSIVIQTKAKKRNKILIVGIDSQEEPFRRSLLAEAISEFGYEVFDAGESFAGSWQPFDLVIARNPHANWSIMKKIASRAGAKLPVFLDFDLDFRLLPENHPDFERLGCSNPERSRAFVAALQMADRLIVPTNALANLLRDQGYLVDVIPDGWSRNNHFWIKPGNPRATLNLGIIALPGQEEDVALLRRPVVRIMREFPQTRLVIIGDPQAYPLFDTLPDVRRVFLPMTTDEDYPFLYTQIDLLLSPLVDSPFNNIRSERKIMEASVRHIPWIASSMPAFKEWENGGYVAVTVDEWYNNLNRLIVDDELRLTLGNAGFQKAAQREIQNIAWNYMDSIQKVCV